ncbi:MAG: ADP-ribosylation factor family protein, partial [Amphiamblys sp. WSBS2006]
MCFLVERMHAFFDWVWCLFAKRRLETAIVGLDGAGKTTLLNYLRTGSFSSQVVPTIGFEMSEVRKGGVVFRVWDLGGKKRFRSMWERYCQGADVILFVVDASARETLDIAVSEFQNVVSTPSLLG